MVEVVKIQKWQLEMGDKIYEGDCSGGSQPAPSSIGSEEIKDDSVEMEDLNQSVKDTMVTSDDRVTQEQLSNFQI